MTQPLYDLMLLLSVKTEDEARAKIVADVEAAIAAGGGSIERNDDWGRRALTYEINHQGEAEYKLLQFTGPTSLLESLSHSLRIDDGVLRFRIIKQIPGTPPAPDPKSLSAPAPIGVGGSSDGDDDE
jgi:small subunit ribosomal protein S6